MAEKTSRERRQARTRQSIIDAARQIIVERGPEELSMRAVADKIDYSASGLYEYFNSKEEIVQTVCLEGHLQLSAALRQVDTSLPPDRYVLEIGLAYIDFALRNPELYQLMFATNIQEVTERGMMDERSSFLILMRGIQRGVEQGVFIPKDGFSTLEMSFAAWSMVHGISMLRLYMANFPGDFEVVRRASLATFIEGLKGNT